MALVVMARKAYVVTPEADYPNLAGKVKIVNHEGSRCKTMCAFVNFVSFVVDDSDDLTRFAPEHWKGYSSGERFFHSLIPRNDL